MITIIQCLMMNYWCQVIVVPDPDKVKWYDNDVDGDDYDYDDIIDDDDDVDSIAASIFVDITVLVKSNNNSTNIEAAMLSIRGQIGATIPISQIFLQFFIHNPAFLTDSPFPNHHSFQG